MTPVKSESLAAVAHDPATKTLTVQFKNGSKYAYQGVSSAHHAALMRADSIGTHFQKNIRSVFKATKV
jgi:hypothetical protein